jgi:predicted acetyltransferase
VKIRHPALDEYDRLTDIFIYCFPAQREHADFTRQQVKILYPPENILCFYQDDQLEALVMVEEHKTYMNGIAMPTAGLSNVSSMPEGRHQGRITQLIVEWLRSFKEKGIYLSMLGPFSYEYYERLGWGQAFERLSCQIPIEHFSGFKRQGAMKPASAQDIPVLDCIYEPMARKYNGCFLRNADIWQQGHFMDRWTGKNRFIYLYCSASGIPEGYISYNIKDQQMEVREFCANSLYAMQGIMNFIYAHQAQCSQVLMTLPPDALLVRLLPNPRFETRLQAGMMLRIVDVPGAISQRGGLGIKCQLSIRIRDPLAEWNNKCFSIELDGVSAGAEACASATIECDIQSLSQLFIGFLSARELYSIGKIKCNENDLVQLDQCFPKAVTYYNDYF